MSELTLTRNISSLASRSGSFQQAADGIAAELLAFPGVRAVRVQPRGAQFEGPLVWGESEPDPEKPAVSARASIQSGARVLGDLHLHFDLESAASEQPLRLAQFAAEQLGTILTLENLERQREETLAKIDYFQKQLELRKAFHRARGLLAEHHGIPESEAGDLLRKRAAQSGRPLQAVADAVVEEYDSRNARRPGIRKSA